MKPAMHPDDKKNFLLAIILAAILIVGWQYFVEIPKREQLARWHQQQEQLKKREAETRAAQAVTEIPAEEETLTRAERLARTPRLAIATPSLHGSLNLKGLRLDDLTLARYRVHLENDSPEVMLLTPSGQELPYFMQVGWASADGKTRVPDGQSLWTADKDTLTPGQKVNLRWDNGQGVVFHVQMSVDETYMFSIRQRVENMSGSPVSVAPYGLINRGYEEVTAHNYILHEGPLNVAEGAGLNELEYKKLREDGKYPLQNVRGWLGFTDKYWLTALIPDGQAFSGGFSHFTLKEADRYQADYLGAAQTVAPQGQAESALRFFAGAKEITVLDRYAQGGEQSPPVPLFDRAVDLGMLYFLTKPIFLTLNTFYAFLGNFGLAILLLTVIIKLAMFPLANKAYKATSQLRDLQPQMLALRERHKDDKLKTQQEIMALYKREKVNPAAGCLPMLIQLPVFFALYKVLFVTIEMRHAPFYGWIRDLSDKDPSNLFTVFGLIDWVPPFHLHLGLLPILMCLSMAIQMAQQPKPADPVQAKVMKWMPYVFIIFFANMPAGLLLYWTWSNILSILQQFVITKKLHAKPPVKAKAKA